MTSTNASTAICGDPDLTCGRDWIGDGRLVVAGSMHITFGKDGRHRHCLDALVHDRAAGRVVMASITYLYGDGLKFPLPGHSTDLAFEAWADQNGEITGRLAGAAEDVRRAAATRDVVPRPRELVFDTAIRVPTAQR